MALTISSRSKLSKFTHSNTTYIKKIELEDNRRIEYSRYISIKEIIKALQDLKNENIELKKKVEILIKGNKD